MNAAERIFLDKGVEAATIEDITRGAGVAKGTFYLHFSSKGDVVEGLRSRFVQRILDAIVKAVDRREERDWQGKVTTWSATCAACYLDAARVHRLVFASNPPPPPDGLMRNILVDHLAGLLASGTRANAWSVADPRFTAVFLFNALHGVVGHGDGRDDPSARRQLLRDIETHTRRCLGLP